MIHKCSQFFLTTFFCLSLTMTFQAAAAAAGHPSPLATTSIDEENKLNSDESHENCCCDESRECPALFLINLKKICTRYENLIPQIKNLDQLNSEIDRFEFNFEQAEKASNFVDKNITQYHQDLMTFIKEGEPRHEPERKIAAEKLYEEYERNVAREEKKKALRRQEDACIQLENALLESKKNIILLCDALAEQTEPDNVDDKNLFNKVLTQKENRLQQLFSQIDEYTKVILAEKALVQFKKTGIQYTKPVLVKKALAQFEEASIKSQMDFLQGSEKHLRAKRDFLQGSEKLIKSREARLLNREVDILSQDASLLFQALQRESSTLSTEEIRARQINIIRLQRKILALQKQEAQADLHDIEQPDEIIAQQEIALIQQERALMQQEKALMWQGQILTQKQKSIDLYEYKTALDDGFMQHPDRKGAQPSGVLILR